MNPQTDSPKKYVVIAEDDDVFAKLYKSKLVNDTTEVDIVSNGEEAIAKASVRKPNLMILDLVMPTKDGMETLKEIRDTDGLKDVQILIVSNFPKDSYYEDAKRLGVADCLYKPNMANSEIIEVIQSYLK